MMIPIENCLYSILRQMKYGAFEWSLYCKYYQHQYLPRAVVSTAFIQKKGSMNVWQLPSQMVSGKQNKLYKLQAYINYQSKIQDSGGDSSDSSLSYEEMGE